MKHFAPAVLMVLRDKLVDELLEKVEALERRLEITESLSIRQARREIATGALAEGFKRSDEQWTVDLIRQDVCLLTDLLDSEIRLGHDAVSTTPPLRIADKWHCCQWVGWRLTDDFVLMEITHADFSIRFTSVLEPSTDRLVRMAGLLQGTLSPQILAPHCLASAEHRMVVHLTTLQVRTVSDWLVR